MAAALFPRVMPSFGFREAAMNPHPWQATGLKEGGSDFTFDRGSVWKGRWQTNKLSQAGMGEARSFRDSLKGGGRHFLAWDPLREYPLAYMPRGWPVAMARPDAAAFDGTAVLGAVSTLVEGRDGAALWDLPTGFCLQAGDHLSLQWADLPATPPTIDFSASVASWTMNAATFAISGDGAVWTATGSDPQLIRAGLSIDGSIYSRLMVDIERTNATGTFEGNLNWKRSGVAQTAVPIRIPSVNGQRRRLTLDMGALAPAWLTGTITEIRFDPVTNTGATFKFRSVRLEDGRWAKQQYSLHRILDVAPVYADAAGAVTVWVEPGIPLSVPLGAIARLYRPYGKFRKIGDGDLTAFAEGGERPGDYWIEGVSTLR